MTEADKIARQLACLRWRQERELEHLMGDPLWCDPLIAGWWLYGVCCQIGPFIQTGPWTVDPATGRIIKQGRGTREPGVLRARPHLGNHGVGVNRPQLREPGVLRARPHISDNGRGVNHAGTREPGVGEEPEFHPRTMPELRRWFAWLSARLRHVRIVNGDWSRVCTKGATHMLHVSQGKGVCGLFLDPPYDNAERVAGLYHHDDGNVAADVRKWCIKAGQDKALRIVLAGYDTEHADLVNHGWTVHEWFTPGHLTGGYGNLDAEDGHQQHRERLWASPHCVRETDGQLRLFDEVTS